MVWCGVLVSCFDLVVGWVSGYINFSLIEVDTFDRESARESHRTRIFSARRHNTSLDQVEL